MNETELLLDFLAEHCLPHADVNGIKRGWGQFKSSHQSESKKENDWEIRVLRWGKDGGLYEPYRMPDYLERIKEGKAEIHSVLRKSDNEVFSVGDEIDHRESEDCKWNNSPSKLLTFSVRDKMMIVEMMENDETNPAGSICRELCDVKKLFQPKATTDRKEERIEVTELVCFDRKGAFVSYPTNRYQYLFYTENDQPIPEEKYPSLKGVIEFHLNYSHEKDEDRVYEKKYTQEQYDLAVRDAFEAARKMRSKDYALNERAFQYPTFQDFQNTKNKP